VNCAQRILIPGFALAIAAGVSAPHVRAQDLSGQLAARAGSSLGIGLYHSIAAKPGNVVFSPYSISEVISLLSAGAAGRTKDELLQALHWDWPPDQLPAAFAAQDRTLAHAAQGGVTLMVANGLWYQRSEPPFDSFLQVARDDFGAEIRGADFASGSAAAEAEINSWVEQKTAGKITGLLPPGTLDQKTRMALVNAVYFKGRWEHPFDPRGTLPRPFFILPGTSVGVTQMTVRGNFRAASDPACDFIELPYQGGELSMVIFLPRERDGLPALEESLDSASLTVRLASLDFTSERRVHVTLPRFKMTYSVELTGALRNLGIAAAFDPSEADFSAINGKRDLHVSTVLHKAFIDVNEAGTEAAAATFGGMVALGIPISDEFRVDHPFLFLIRDNLTGSLLFLGRVEDPRTG
jgi:serpin B